MSKQKSVPSYRYHKARDCAVVTINGRNFYLGPFNTPASKEKYARLIAEFAVTGNATPQPRSTQRPPLTITELCVSHWQWAQAYYQRGGKPTGQLHIVKMALREVRQLYGGTHACDFGPLAFRALQESMVAAGRSRNVINQLCAIVRRMFRWAASHEMLPASIFQSLATVPGLKRGRTAARETAPVQPVDDATFQAALPYLSPVVADMARLQAMTGARPTEICRIRPTDVDTSTEVWVYTPAEHKTEHHGRQRRIFIGPRGQDILRAYLLRPSDSYCFSPVDSERKRHVEMRDRRKTKLQPSQRDRRKAKPKRQPQDHYTKDSYARAIRRACEKAGVTSWSPNRIRHAAGTAIRKRYGIEAAQTVLGHSKASTTEIYAERDFARAAQVMKAIG